MKKIILLALLVVSLAAQAYEPMIREDRVWEYYFIVSRWGTCTNYLYTLQFDGTQEVNGKTYHQLKMTLFAKRVARAIKAALPCRKVGVTVLGLEVPHAHIHLVPLKHEGDMDFKHKIDNPDAEKMKQIAAAIRENFE